VRLSPVPGEVIRNLQLAPELEVGLISLQRGFFWPHCVMVYERVFAYNQDMRLWLLRPRDDVLARSAHPWTPKFDKVMGVVVRAEDEADARELAQGQAGDEGLGVYVRFGLAEDEVAADVWLDPGWTSCEELLPEGEAGAILVDRREA
jgi:hypothetical protein